MVRDDQRRSSSILLMPSYRAEIGPYNITLVIAHIHIPPRLYIFTISQIVITEHLIQLDRASIFSKPLCNGLPLP